MSTTTPRRALGALILTLAMSSAWGSTAPAPPSISIGGHSKASEQSMQRIANPSNYNYLRLATWDAGSLASSNQSTNGKNLYSVATVIAQFDVVLLQSNAPSTQLASLISTLGGLTGANWNYSAVPTKLLGPNTPRLAIIWREDRVNGVEAGPGYPDRDEQPRPISLELAFKGHRFWVVDYSRAATLESPRSKHQLNTLAYYAANIIRRTPGIPVIVGGDFGAGPGTGMFKMLSRFLVPAVPNGGSIIDPGDGQPSSPLADDLWTNIGFPYQAGVLPLDRVVGMSANEVVETVSTHAPVFAMINFP